MSSPRATRGEATGDGRRSSEEKAADVTANSHVVEEVLSKMMLADKIGQMSQIDIVMLLEEETKDMVLNLDKVKHFIGELGVGSVLNTVPVPWTAQQYRRAAMQIQEIATQYNRPPVIWGLDSVHGANYVHGASWTPQPINVAASMNHTVSWQAGRLASRDTRAAGINWLFAPLIGLALQPYWSRVYETFGEDPLLVGRMAAAMISGIQAVDPISTAVPSRAAACAKHFVGYSYPHNGHDRAPSWIPRRHLYQYFVPPWQDAMDAEVLTVMESYTEVDGVPNVANSETTRYLLRQRLGFGGVLVTDYEEILNLHEWHHTVKDGAAAVVHALQAGTVDMSMIPWDADGFRGGALEAVRDGRVDEERIHESARRVLQLKAQLHMFDEVMTEEDPNLDLVGTDEDLVLDMARQSIVLTKNDHNSTLPWDIHSKGHKILVTGPTAASRIYLTGGWSGQWQGPPNEDDWLTSGSSVLTAVSSVAGMDVSYSCGTNILGGECDDDKSKQGVVEEMKGWVGLGPHNAVDRAVEVAKDADLVVVCVGEEAYTEKPGDIRSLRLPNGQYELVRSLASETDAKIVLVYFGGRPRLLGSMVEHVHAVLIGFLPGPAGGQAVSDILTGVVNPSGRLPMTYPISADASGSPYFNAVSDQCTAGGSDTKLPHYTNVPCSVQWPFGHGLSYTTFTYSGLSVTGDAGSDVHISFDVKNTGNQAGAEAVLSFTFDEFRATTPEYKRLRDFQKIFLAPNESQTMQVTLTLEELQFVGPDDDTHYMTDPTKPFWVGIGASTDCRANPSDDLCVYVQPSGTKDLTEPSCLAACDLWIGSGCAEAVGLSQDACIQMCSMSGNRPVTYAEVGSKGWGWNYVYCLEAVVWGMQHSQSRCEDMPVLCRDIFASNGLNEFGSGVLASAPTHSTPSATIVALLTGIISSVVVLLLVRGKFQLKDDRESLDNIQFTTVTTDEED